MQPRLIDQDMRHFRRVILDILNPPDTLDILRVFGVRHPETGLVDPIAFALDCLGNPKGLEHFHCAGIDPVGLALVDIAGSLLDDHRFDLGELRKLRRKTKPRWPGTGNQHIDLFGQWRLVRPVPSIWGRIFDVRITAAKTIKVILHLIPPKNFLTPIA